MIIAEHSVVSLTPFLLGRERQDAYPHVSAAHQVDLQGYGTLHPGGLSPADSPASSYSPSTTDGHFGDVAARFDYFCLSRRSNPSINRLVMCSYNRRAI